MLIHGYTDSARRMYFTAGIAQELAKKHRVVAIDNRNHGESHTVQENGTGIARDTIELMAHELGNVQNVVLPQISHMTAIAVGGPMPQLYIDSLATFINAKDK